MREAVVVDDDGAADVVVAWEGGDGDGSGGCVNHGWIAFFVLRWLLLVLLGVSVGWGW